MTERVGGGFGGQEAAAAITVASTATASAVVDLGRNYALIWVTCDDCQFIPAATTMTAEIGLTAADTVKRVFFPDAPATRWVTGVLPTTAVTWGFLFTEASGARRIKLTLSNAATGGDVDFEVMGLDPAFPQATV